MAIQYAGGTIVNATFAPTTRADIVNSITSNLLTAGWTAISGTPGVSSDVTMESAATAAGAKVRFRFLDPGTGNCAQITMKHASGSPTSQIAYCLPSNTWRILCNKYQFFAFMTGGGNAVAARGAVLGGQIYSPSFISVSSGDAVAWMQFAGTIDTDAATKYTFRRNIAPRGTNSPGWSGLFGSTLVESTTNLGGAVSLINMQGGLTSGDMAYRWEDGTVQLYEALISWATGSLTSNEGRIKGQLWDAMIVSGVYTSETLVNFDGHDFLAITDSAFTNSDCTSTLFVAIN